MPTEGPHGGVPEGLPDAERALAALADKMRGAVAVDAKLIGIYSGGAWLAERLAALLPGEHPVGFIDVSFYRDDYGQKGLRAKVETTTLPFEVEGSRIVLIDDVLYTGRSVRAAINELFDYGRPERIELAVLAADRSNLRGHAGHRGARALGRSQSRRRSIRALGRADAERTACLEQALTRNSTPAASFSIC